MHPRNAEWKSGFLQSYPRLAESLSVPEREALLAEGRVFSIAHEGRSWIPGFQFGADGPIPVIAELLSLFERQLGSKPDGWDLALFLCQPSGYLRGIAPMEIIGDADAAPRVLMAARAYVGLGDAS